jgi:hypothetical protein
MNWSDPRIVNYVIIGLFAVAAVRWSFAGNWWQALYWAAAGVLNVAITGMAKT